MAENHPKFIGEEFNINGVENDAPNFEIPKATLKEIIFTDYIRKSLDKVAENEGFQNYEFVTDHGSSIGDGFIGIIIKVTIQEKDKSKSLKVLAKIPPQNKLRRDAMKSMNLFNREIFMYNIFLPQMVKFQREHKISQENGFLNFPKVYFAEYNEEEDDAIIIMEDLRDSGHRMWNKFKPIDYEHAKLMVTSLARLHGLSFAMKALKPEQFEKFKELDDLFSKMGDEKNFEQYVTQLLISGVNTIDPSDTKRRRRAEYLLKGFKELVIECVSTEAAEPYCVIGHGDCWFNNFLFNYNYRGIPKEIKLIDWQVARYGSPVLDLVYFIFICTDHAFRVKHFDELINIYHRTIKEFLDAMKCDIASQFPMTALLRQLKKFGKFGVVTSILLTPTIQSKSEDLMDMDVMAEKMQNGEMDPALQEQLMKMFSDHQALSNDKIRDLILDAIQYGYL